MKFETHFWETKNLITQFLAAFDNVIINRYDKNRAAKEKVQVRYVYGPKEKVLYDIVNKAQNITLPVISVNMTGIARDSSRAFNKLRGFDLPSNTGSIAHIGMPVPVNLDISMNIMTYYQADMDQILSNFIPYSNPYIVLAWQIPAEFNTDSVQEIRSEVLWDENVRLEYPIELAPSDKPRIIATTNFTIKGWLFPAIPKDESKRIFFINSDFHTVDFFTKNKFITIDDYATVSAVQIADYVTLSAAPSITNIYFSTSAGSHELFADQILYQSNLRNTITLVGKRFDYTQNVYLSSNTAMMDTLTSKSYKYYPTFSAYVLPVSTYQALTPNVLTVSLPALSTGTFDIIVADEAGWASSYSTGYHFKLLS